GQDHVRRQRDEFGSVLANAPAISGDPARLNAHVTAFDPSQFLQALHESGEARLTFLVARRQTHERADAPYALALLSARRKRPGTCRAGNYFDKLAPSHSITSSAAMRIEGGTVSPSDLAVFTLTSSSNLVACTTGRSAGFSPFKIRPT